MKVIQISKEFAEQNDKLLSANKTHQFGYNVTKDGHYFCAIEFMNIFSELFEQETINIIDVTEDDLIEGIPLEDIKHPEKSYIKTFDYGQIDGINVQVGLVRVPTWDADKILVECDFIFEDGTVKSRMISVDNDFQVDGVGVYELFKTQLENNTSLYPLVEQLLLARRDWIIENRL